MRVVLPVYYGQRTEYQGTPEGSQTKQSIIFIKWRLSTASH